VSLPLTALVVLFGTVLGAVARETGRHHVRPGRRPDQRSGRPVAGPTRRRPGHIADTVRFVPVDELPVERTDVVVDDVRLVRPYVVGRGR